MQYKFEQDARNNFEVIAPTKQDFQRKNVKNRNKSVIFNIFTDIIELVQDLVTSKMQNNLRKIGLHEKLFFKLLCPQGNVYNADTVTTIATAQLF